METRTCKRQSSATCTTTFEPDFARQKNCQACKAYDLAQKQKSRTNIAAKQKAKHMPTYMEWNGSWSQDFPQQHKELREFEQQIVETVSEELGRRLSDDEGETVYHLAVTSFCFKKAVSPYVRAVTEPIGTVVGGGFYPEVIGRSLVRNTHRFGLETSATYAGLYRPLLTILDKKFGKNADSSDEYEGGSARAVKAELNGTNGPASRAA